METILNYIEQTFKNLPQTNEVLKAKKELCQMMEDKYCELKKEGKSENEAIGTIISEFGNLEELSEDLGIKDIYSSNKSKTSSSDDIYNCEEVISKNPKTKYKNRTLKTIMEVYWPTVTCIYFAVSFITFKWNYTWIIWIAAAILQPILNNFFTEEKEEDLYE
ncbi:MAG: permease prefix domain 1-containing protein [Treponema sp.]|nr:permease prefix domain 1-containing protein [Treponema sp.]